MTDPFLPSGPPPAGRWRRLLDTVLHELRQLLRFNRSDRRWQMPFCSALAQGLPLLVGVALDHLAWGLVACMGSMVFIYAPPTPLWHRMVTLMASAFGMSACYALGLLSQLWPALQVPVLTFITIVVLMVCRFYALGPPGSLFFVMPAAIGAFTPLEAGQLAQQLPLHVGLVTLGALQACLIAFFYSLYILRLEPAQPVAPLPPATFDHVVFEPVLMGLFVGGALLLAQALQMPRAYWVPMSCLAVIQGASLRAVWTKQVHRVAGTALGLVLAWGLLRLSLGPWSVALVLMLLAFVIETLVVRHYGLAAVFITPLTIYLAEAAHLGQGRAADALLQARLLDTVLGALVAMLGGVCLHQPRCRAVLGGWLRRLAP